MTTRELTEKLLRAYSAYYNVERETPAPPFTAEAVFHSHSEQYFLIKSARLAETESNEYVFFAEEERLDEARLRALAESAWQEGTSRVQPHEAHQSSDIILIALADRVEPEALALAPRLKYYRSYRWGLQGWSHFRLIVVETATGRMACNRQGQSLKGVVQSNIKSV
ncbi:MAG: hypothetical protein IJ713_06215 [Oscillibacter sp.]|nr:hypothetical protein [Oscillibacter sp.]